MDICNDSTDKLERNIRLTMESSNSDSFETTMQNVSNYSLKNESSTAISTLTSSTTTRSTASGFAIVNRKELIEKINKLKRKWDLGIQFAFVLYKYFFFIGKFLEYYHC